MISKVSLPKKQTVFVTGLIIVLSIVIVLQISMLVEKYFNTKELNYLVDEAHKRNLSYQLIIHNPHTNSYSFQIIEE